MSELPNLDDYKRSSFSLPDGRKACTAIINRSAARYPPVRSFSCLVQIKSVRSKRRFLRTSSSSFPGPLRKRVPMTTQLLDFQRVYCARRTFIAAWMTPKFPGHLSFLFYWLRRSSTFRDSSPFNFNPAVCFASSPSPGFTSRSAGDGLECWWLGDYRLVSLSSHDPR